MVISATNFISETILFVRDRLKALITDPISATRTKGRFVMTSYPREKVQYPIITVRGINVSGEPLGQQSEQMMIRFDIEARVWARNEKEKNNISDEVIKDMKDMQFPSETANTSENVQLHDFAFKSAVEVDEEGEEGIKSRVMIFGYMFIAT